ncbi:hypothetical protein O0544_18120 [Edwardsiella anguillarum]|nr:hypothetical protein [Edwardsiella anguillarum]
MISYRQPLPGVAPIAQALAMEIRQDVFDAHEDIDALLLSEEIRAWMSSSAAFWWCGQRSGTA